jgi:signal transduction histidine kinase
VKTPRLRATVAFRLTLWYAAGFSISSMLAMTLVYSSVSGVLRARTDAELRQDLEETVSLVNRGGVRAFQEELAREVSGPDSSIVFLRLWSAEGIPLASVGFDVPDAMTRDTVNGQRTASNPTLRTVHPAGFECAVRVGYVAVPSGFVVEFGQTLGEVEELLDALRTGILVALPTVLLLGGPIGWFLARRALRGVETVTRTALDIAGGALDRRVPVGSRGDELDRLASAFNTMLDRIQALMTGMREVTDNLAHDLRTPLARVRASAERAAAREATPDEWMTFAGTTTEECDRVLQILNSTLEIAEAQAGAAQLRLEEVDLAGLVNEAHDLFLTLAEDAGIDLRVEAPERCLVRADKSRVQRIVANLVDNALKYTPSGGRVTIALIDGESDVRIEVQDTGAGVAAEELPRIFERFYRGDGSRTGRGSGLGLSLARAFARAHGGELTAVSTPGRGSMFTLRLKRSAV